MVRLR